MQNNIANAASCCNNANVNNTVLSLNIQQNDSFELQNKIQKNPNKKTSAIIITAALATAAIVSAVLINSKKAKPQSDNLKLLKQAYNNIISEFPEDKVYYESLAKNIGLNQGEEYKLTSLVGSKQLKKLLNTYSGENFQVGANFEGVANYTYRVNLHNHTTASDGILTVAEFLEQSRKWADRVAENIPKDNKPPFTVAITDHDTLDGAKEAVKIIAGNPEKYKNLRVVLGSEISVSYLNPEHVVKPVDFELISYCTNPFNKNLNNLLENMRTNRLSSIKTLLGKIKSEYPQYNLSIDDTKKFHSNLRNVRTNGVLNLAGDYAEFKIRLTKYVKQINEKIIPSNEEKLNPQEIFEEMGNAYYLNMDATGERDIAKFLMNSKIKKTLQDRNLLNESNIQEYEDIFKADFSSLHQTISKYVKEGLPTIQDRKGYCLLPEEVFEVVENSDKQGFFGVAHPALMKLNSPHGENISEKRKALLGNNDPNKNLVYEVFHNLKQKGKDLFNATEVNYQSYRKMSDSWTHFMKKDIADNPLLKLQYTGGMDTHSPSIFSNHSYIKDEYVEKYHLSDILGDKYENFANLLKEFKK